MRAIFLHPLRSKSFPFLCKKENIERPRATFMPVFSPQFQPAESIRIHAGPRTLGVTRLLNLFDEGFYADLPGGILESFGRLLKHQLKLFVYPALDKATGEICTVDNLVVPAGQHKLFEYLNERGSFVGLETEHPSLLSIYPKDVLDAMLRRDPVWKSMVPPEVVEAIERKHLFMRDSDAKA